MLHVQNISDGAPSPEEIDVWHTAEQMRKQYGQNAHYQAEMRAGDLLKVGDRIGFVTWKRVARAIQELESLGCAPN
jgi:hypothetical protein